MKARPMLMSAPMVRAILAGTKTQTRRVVKPQPQRVDGGVPFGDAPAWAHAEPGCAVMRCPYGKPGDRLWVRETWGYFDPDCSGYEEEIEDRGKGPGLHCAPEMMQEGHPLRDFWRRRVAYAATWEEPKFGNGPDKPSRWRPSIHMPRWASRITLEVTGVRVERLQDISVADAIAEGIERSGECNWRDYLDHPSNDFANARRSYRSLWEQINGPDSWESNPWVWVVEFKRLEVQQ